MTASGLFQKPFFQFVSQNDDFIPNDTRMEKNVIQYIKMVYEKGNFSRASEKDRIFEGGRV